MRTKTDPELAERRQRVRLLDVERAWRLGRVERAEQAVAQLREHVEALRAAGNLLADLMADRLRAAERELAAERASLDQHDRETLQATAEVAAYLDEMHHSQKEEAC